MKSLILRECLPTKSDREVWLRSRFGDRNAVVPSVVNTLDETLRRLQRNYTIILVFGHWFTTIYTSMYRMVRESLERGNGWPSAYICHLALLELV